MNKTTPDSVYAELCAKHGGHKRSARNLRIIHELCRKASEGSGDFTVATIGQESQKLGGPRLNTLYSPLGKKFKILIEVWAEAYGSKNRKVALTAPKNEKTDYDSILAQIEDVTARQELRYALADLKRFKRDLTIAKKEANGKPAMDFRPKLAEGHLQVIEPSANLNDSERTALENLIDKDWLKRRGLSEGPRGELVQEGRAILEMGTLTGIRKLLVK